VTTKGLGVSPVQRNHSRTTQQKGLRCRLHVYKRVSDAGCMCTLLVHVHVPAKGAHPHTKTGLKRTYCTDSFLSQSSLSQGYGSAQALCHKVHTCQSMCHRHALFLMSTKRAHTPSSVQVSQPCRFLAAAPPPVSCNMLAAQLLSSSS
jgi:hypothetical protein